MVKSHHKAAQYGVESESVRVLPGAGDGAVTAAAGPAAQLG